MPFISMKMPEGHLACVSSMLPLLATHLLKYARWSRPDPLALPAAGFPGSRGGNCLAVSALHFLATSAVIAEADPGSEPSAKHVSANNMHPDLKCVNMTLLSLAVRDDSPRLVLRRCSGHSTQYAEIWPCEKAMFSAHNLV
jgi:hypothetical protein